MKRGVFTILLIFIFANIFAQDSPTFPKNKYADIFNSILLQNKNLYGIFDSTDSWLVVHQDTVFQSPFDSACLRCEGKTWHRGQIVSVKSYFTILQMERLEVSVEKYKDSADDLIPYYTGKNGEELWKCEGEFFADEDITSTFSGRFSGTFDIYVLYNRKTNAVLYASKDIYAENSPVALFNGFWRSYKNNKQSGIPFFWSDLKPSKNADNSYSLPDFRLQADGSNKALFEEKCLIPKENWYE